MIEQYSDYIINTPYVSHLNEKPFISWAHIGVPILASPSQPSPTVSDDRSEVRILHAPSKPAHKGTDRIHAILDRIRKKGLHFHLIEIVDRPNAAVLKSIKECDFVIDQLYTDWPMPMLAQEAAWAWKPTVAGSYAVDLWKKHFPAGACPPSLFCHPEKVEETIEKLIRNMKFRLEMGQRAGQFVRKNWTTLQIAQRFFRIMDGDIPDSWYFDPKETSYLFGGAISKENVRQSVRRVIETDGVKALQLGDKPQLEKAFYQFAFGKK